MQESDTGSVRNICLTLSFFASPIYTPHPEDVILLQADALEEYLISLGGIPWQCWRWLVDTIAGHGWIMGGLVVVLLGLAAGAMTAGMRGRQVSGMTAAAMNDEIPGEACTATVDGDVQGVNEHERERELPRRRPLTRSETTAW